MKTKIKYKKSKLPFVFSNFAITADGKIAFAGGEFVPFGSARDHEHMFELRATADAVMAGARTVEASRATLSPGGKKFQRLRLARGLNEYNLRVIATGSGSINPRAAIFQQRFSPIIALVSERIPKERLRTLRNLVDDVGIFGQTEVDFHAALGWLRSKWKVKRLLCEGGGTVHGTMVRAGLIDELNLTMCPIVFGGRDAATIGDGGKILRLAEAKKFTFTSAKREKDELFVVLRAAKKGRS